MKIRHKQSGVVLEGQFCTCTDDRYMTNPFSYFMSLSGSRYLLSEWEEVKPEPVWKDVTDQMLGVMHHLPEWHRLRKVSVWQGGLALHKRDAFIIEQRQP